MFLVRWSGFQMMAHMRNDGPGADCPDRAFQSCVEMMLSRLTEVELEHFSLSVPPLVHCRARLQVQVVKGVSESSQGN